MSVQHKVNQTVRIWSKKGNEGQTMAMTNSAPRRLNSDVSCFLLRGSAKKRLLVLKGSAENTKHIRKSNARAGIPLNPLSVSTEILFSETITWSTTAPVANVKPPTAARPLFFMMLTNVADFRPVSREEIGRAREFIRGRGIQMFQMHTAKRALKACLERLCAVETFEHLNPPLRSLIRGLFPYCKGVLDVWGGNRLVCATTSVYSQDIAQRDTHTEQSNNTTIVPVKPSILMPLPKPTLLDTVMLAAAPTLEKPEMDISP